jgi:hypothetical protein
MCMHKLWTTNTITFYLWQFECRDTVTRSKSPLSCHSSSAITSCFSMIMHGPCRKDLYTIPGSWKCPSFSWPAYSPDMSHIWGWLGCSGSTCKTACSSSCHYPANLHSHWRGVRQHSTGHNQQYDQLYALELYEVNCGHTRYRLVFWSTPIPFHKVAVTNRLICINLYSQSCEIHRLCPK